MSMQGCSNTELSIVGNSNKLIYLTSTITDSAACMHTALSVITLRFLLFSYRRNSRFHTSTPGISRNFSKELISIAARFLNSNVT